MSDYFVHRMGICETAAIGHGTRIWAFAHVLAGARIGSDCNICDGVFIEGNAIIGDRVTVKCGVQLWDGIELENDVFVGPNATFTNDPMPRSRRWPAEYPRTIVRAGASIGANATILPGIEIGRGAMVGAGAVVTRSVPPHAVVIGNPARIKGYLETSLAGASTETSTALSSDDRLALGVGRSYLRRFPEFTDLRGKLTAGEFPTDAVPFVPKRWFLVYDVPTREVRGEHAHRVCHQFLICIAGRVSVAVDDGHDRREVTLDSPTVGIYIPPLVWGTQFRYEAESVLLVFASHEYDPRDYIREYDSFLEAVGASSALL